MEDEARSDDDSCTGHNSSNYIRGIMDAKVDS